MNPYLHFVESIKAGVADAKPISASGKTEPVKSTSKVLLFSPHPDDECITGLLPLRLMREAGKQIINIPVTFGSKVERRAGRAKELTDACAYLGWTVFHGAENFQPLGVVDAVRILKKFRPEIIFMPHAKDQNVRHISTHVLVMDALRQMEDDFSCTVVETEFWSAMEHPNLMVEADAQTVADLIAATSFHAEEVKRNPYHLSLPAWMQDNVRRGSELVGTQGGDAPEFTFATLYHVSRWTRGAQKDFYEGGRNLPCGENVAEESRVTGKTVMIKDFLAKIG
ncbi:MAG: PIG-L family deacetylase [Kiritimatiellaceae bacterium]|nr:PIG-L family deacetylase [Kiritimatiellaceae bacterium]